MDFNNIKIIIREMELDDLEKSVSLIRKVIILSNSKDYSKIVIQNLLNHYSLSNFRKMFLRRKNYIALVNNRIVGTVSCEENTVYSLFVDPEYQNRGIGKLLLKRIEEYISSNGYKKVNLSSSLTAVSFYEKNGYIEIEKVKGNDLGDVINMEKVISN